MPEKKNRKKRDTSQKRQIILEGAIEVFIEKGFKDSSMDEIAQNAGVSKRTVYNHFQSKEFLFQEIVEGFLKEREKIKPIKYSHDITLKEQLITFAKAELFLIDDPIRRGLSKLLTSTFLIDIEFGRKIRNGSEFNPYNAFIIWLNCAQEDGRISVQSPELAARIFYGLVEGCLTWPALLTDGQSLKVVEPQLDEIVNVFLSQYGKLK